MLDSSETAVSAANDRMVFGKWTQHIGEQFDEIEAGIGSFGIDAAMRL